MSENNYTICGGCNLRVPCYGFEPEPHMCEIISELKRSLNAALSDIQKSFENNLEVHKEFTRNHIAQRLTKYDDRIQGLHKRIEYLEGQLKTCIDVKLLYSDRQARETWQNGCDVMISNLIQRIDHLTRAVSELNPGLDMSIHCGFDHAQ